MVPIFESVSPAGVTSQRGNDRIGREGFIQKKAELAWDSDRWPHREQTRGHIETVATELRMRGEKGPRDGGMRGQIRNEGIEVVEVIEHCMRKGFVVVEALVDGGKTASLRYWRGGSIGVRTGGREGGGQVRNRR